MLSFDDERWSHLTGGYKSQLDPRPWLRKLEKQQDTSAVWKELWDELHHQGDVGTASYAAVPELVRICSGVSSVDWNLYAMVATIELARTEPGNPPLPDWLDENYLASIQQLAQTGLAEILLAKDTEAKRAILSVIAIAKGLRTHGKFLINYSEEELLDMDGR